MCASKNNFRLSQFPIRLHLTLENQAELFFGIGRALSEAEVAKFGLKSYAFAIDGVAAVVHPKNPVANLTRQQVQDIFAGKIANWKAVAEPTRSLGG